MIENEHFSCTQFEFHAENIEQSIKYGPSCTTF